MKRWRQETERLEWNTDGKLSEDERMGRWSKTQLKRQFKGKRDWELLYEITELWKENDRNTVTVNNVFFLFLNDVSDTRGSIMLGCCGWLPGRRYAFTKWESTRQIAIHTFNWKMLKNSTLSKSNHFFIIYIFFLTITRLLKLLVWICTYLLFVLNNTLM